MGSKSKVREGIVGPSESVFAGKEAEKHYGAIERACLKDMYLITKEKYEIAKEDYEKTKSLMMWVINRHYNEQNIQARAYQCLKNEKENLVKDSLNMNHWKNRYKNSLTT